MTNFIKRLQSERNKAELEVHQLREGIRQLQSYLHSPKFHEDTTVQVSDVLLRLSEVLSNATGEVEQ